MMVENGGCSHVQRMMNVPFPQIISKFDRGAESVDYMQTINEIVTSACHYFINRLHIIHRLCSSIKLRNNLRKRDIHHALRVAAASILHHHAGDNLGHTSSYAEGKTVCSTAGVVCPVWHVAPHNDHVAGLQVWRTCNAIQSEI